MSFKAVLDTNVVISGIFWRGNPFEILKAWQGGRFVLTISIPILEEYRRVLDEMSKKRPLQTATRVLEFIELRAELITPISFKTVVCRDPDDDKFLEAAVAANAAYVVSGDADLLTLKSYELIQIVNPAQFLKVISAKPFS